MPDRSRMLVWETENMGTVRVWCGVLGLLLAGCATVLPPGRSGEVVGALRSIELYPARAEASKVYPTAARERLFASDREAEVVLLWRFPRPGSHVTRVALRTPTGRFLDEQELRTTATQAEWLTRYRFPLPQDSAARDLAGVWQAEVTLDEMPAGRRRFVFDPGSIRLRTAERVLLVEGGSDPEAATGDWFWRDRAGALESIKAAHALLGAALRDELARRLPRVDGPQPSADGSDAQLLVRTTLAVSPNPDMPRHLTVEVVHVPTQTAQVFQFRSTAGADLASKSLDYGTAAVDLAFQAAGSPEVMQALVTAAQAVPE